MSESEDKHGRARELSELETELERMGEEYESMRATGLRHRITHVLLSLIFSMALTGLISLPIFGLVLALGGEVWLESPVSLGGLCSLFLGMTVYSLQNVFVPKDSESGAHTSLYWEMQEQRKKVKVARREAEAYAREHHAEHGGSLSLASGDEAGGLEVARAEEGSLEQAEGVALDLSEDEAERDEVGVSARRGSRSG